MFPRSGSPSDAGTVHSCTSFASVYFFLSREHKMSSIEILTLEQAKLLHLDWPDVYETPWYAEADLCSQSLGTRWELAIWTLSDKKIVYGYYKRPIIVNGKTLCYDLSTVYGYGAPFAVKDVDADTWSAFRRDFETLCVKYKYVSEFIRFSPLRSDEALKCAQGSADMHCWLHQTTVAVKLDAYSSCCSKSFSRGLSRTKKAGYDAEVRLACANDIDQNSAFYRLYEITMHRKSASEFYFFSAHYFTKLLENLSALKDCGLYISIVRSPSNDIVSTGLFMHFGKHFHYHLSAYSVIQGVYMNNMMLDAATRFARDELHCSTLHLGGGIQDGDSLFSFKRSIGDRELNWYLGKSIMDKDTYKEIVRRRASALEVSPTALIESTKYHPVYRHNVLMNDIAFTNERIRMGSFTDAEKQLVFEERRHNPRLLEHVDVNEYLDKLEARAEDKQLEVISIFDADYTNPLGCIAFYANQPPHAFITLLIVSCRHRKLGLGRSLLRMALEHSHKLGATTCDLETFSHLNAAVALYKSIGFSEISRDGEKLQMRLMLDDIEDVISTAA